MFLVHFPFLGVPDIIDWRMDPFLDEVQVQIPQRHLEGGLFLAFIALFPLLILTVFVGLDILQDTLALCTTYLLFYLLRKINDERIKAGPAHAWFRHGMLNAWITLDEEDLLVRSLWTPAEAYKPSRIDWTSPRSFTVEEGETSFEIVFQSPDDAERFATRMKANIPGILESTFSITPPTNS